MGDFSKDPFCAEWKDSIFKKDEKMNTSDTFSASCQHTDIPSGAKVLYTQPVFKVKLQNIPNYYKFYTCMVAISLAQIQGIDFDMYYLSTSAFDNFRMIIVIAATKNMIIYGLDVSNVFQTNIEEKPYDR
eukprot:894911-Ditylum_brightwellii.AAC.1